MRAMKRKLGKRGRQNGAMGQNKNKYELGGKNRNRVKSYGKLAIIIGWIYITKAQPLNHSPLKNPCKKVPPQ